MIKFEDYIIQESYAPTSHESFIIDKLKSSGLTKEDWESGLEGIKSFKRNIRKWLYYRQNCLCAYCRTNISEVSFKNIDHIVPKSTHPEWMFEPRNLCIACQRCNTNKNDTETLDNYSGDVYPTKGRYFKIINPYIDKYSKHIMLVEDLIYMGITKKGHFTIKECGLSHYSYVLERAKRKMEISNPDSVKMQVISLIPYFDVEDEEEFLETINTISQKVEERVRAYKTRHA